MHSYDWVFVFQVRDEWDDLDDFQKEFSMKRVINALAAAGLHTSQFYSVQRDEVYCKIRCPRDRLVAQAVSRSLNAHQCLSLSMSSPLV